MTGVQTCALPIFEAKEYQIYEHYLTKEELETEKFTIHQEKMENLTEKGVQILENRVKIVNKDSGWEICGEFLLEEKIGVGRSLEKTGIGEEPSTPDESGMLGE